MLYVSSDAGTDCFSSKIKELGTRTKVVVDDT